MLAQIKVGSRFVDVQSAQVSLSMRSVVVVMMAEVEELQGRRDKEKEVDRNRKWKARASLLGSLRYVLPSVARASLSAITSKSHDYDSSTLIGLLHSSHGHRLHKHSV